MIAQPGPTALLMGNAMATGRSGAVTTRMVLAENAQAFARVGGPFAFASAFLISCRQEYICYFSFACVPIPPSKHMQRVSPYKRMSLCKGGGSNAFREIARIVLLKKCA